jgi:hypothetical protein
LVVQYSQAFLYIQNSEKNFKGIIYSSVRNPVVYLVLELNEFVHQPYLDVANVKDQILNAFL